MTTTEKPMVEELKDTVVNDEQPIDKKAPGSSFMLVALSYMAILALAAIGFGIIYWLFM